jgi:hypothetical protein
MCLAGGWAAMAQSVTVRIARQFGISYIAPVFMPHRQTCRGTAMLRFYACFLPFMPSCSLIG